MSFETFWIILCTTRKRHLVAGKTDMHGKQYLRERSRAAWVHLGACRLVGAFDRVDWGRGDSEKYKNTENYTVCSLNNQIFKCKFQA